MDAAVTCDLCGDATYAPRTLRLCEGCYRDVLGEASPAERVRRVLYTPREDARVLGVSPRTIRKLIATGRLRALDLADSGRRHGHRWRIRRRDLIRLLAHSESHYRSLCLVLRCRLWHAGRNRAGRITDGVRGI